MSSTTSTGVKRGRPGLAFFVGAVVIGAMGVFWIWAFFFATGEFPGQLDDESIAAAMEAECAPHREAVDALPSAAAATSPEDRAEVLAVANTELAAMVASLAPIAERAEGGDVQRVELWLEDWDVLLARREAYVEQLSAGVDDRFYVEADAEGRPILGRMEDFAEVNEMPSCAPPPDLG